MKPWFILIGLAVGITAAVTVAIPFVGVSSSERGPILHAAPPKPEGPTPTVFVEEGLTYDFGILPQQQFGKHAWVFKNTGAGPLELKGDHTTCSCTNSDLFVKQPDGQWVGQVKTLKPGESLVVNVSFETRTWDKYFQTVTIATNDPSNPQVVLTIVGKVRPAISTIPADPSINFQSVSNEDPTIRRVVLFSSDRPELKLIRLVSSNPALISAEPRPMTPEELTGYKVEKGYVITTTVKPSPILGDFAEEVVIETDHPLMKEFRYKVRGKMTGPISVMPDKVTMRDATSLKGGSEVLTLWARGRTSVNFIIEKKPPGMEVAIEPIPPVAGSKSSKYKMTVKLIPGTDSGRISDEIVLKTDDPKANEVRVPVEVLVKGAS